MKAMLLATALAVAVLAPRDAAACCPAPPSGKPVVNADQTVVIVWDAAKKTEHFIRRASFKSEAADFGFLVPTPSKPELAESGDDAFPFLAKVTAPEVKRVKAPSAGCGCPGARSKSASVAPSRQMPEVTVLEEKTVAGFDAKVLEAKSAGDLVAWLKEKGYAFSPEVEAWAKPYVDGGWKITALRVAKAPEGQARPTVATSSLRLSFQTEAPLFPYREPDTAQAAPALGATSRLLRIFFLADGRYQGSLVGKPWTGQTAWAGAMSEADRKQALGLLRLPESGGGLYLTEFEDPWPYAKAPSDLAFARAATQEDVRREPLVEYTANDVEDAKYLAFGGVVFVPRLLRRLRRRARRQGGSTASSETV